jgi:hypothetical protein
LPFGEQPGGLPEVDGHKLPIILFDGKNILAGQTFTGGQSVCDAGGVIWTARTGPLNGIKKRFAVSLFLQPNLGGQVTIVFPDGTGYTDQLSRPDVNGYPQVVENPNTKISGPDDNWYSVSAQVHYVSLDLNSPEGPWHQVDVKVECANYKFNGGLG